MRGLTRGEARSARRLHVSSGEGGVQAMASEAKPGGGGSGQGVSGGIGWGWEVQSSVAPRSETFPAPGKAAFP